MTLSSHGKLKAHTFLERLSLEKAKVAYQFLFCFKATD